MPTAKPARTLSPVRAIWVLLTALLAACSGQLSARTYGMLTHNTALTIAEQAIPARLPRQSTPQMTAR